MKNKFCPRWGLNPRPPAFAASVLTARPRGPHGRERTTPRLILKHLVSISPQRHQARYHLAIGKSIQKPSGINSISQCRSNLFSFMHLLSDGIWLGAFVEKYLQGVLILVSVLIVLYREALVVERLRRLPRMQEVVGSNPTEDKICFSQFTLFYRVECEKLFCKTNLKLKVLK